MQSIDSRPFSRSSARHSPWLSPELRRRLQFMWMPKAMVAATIASLAALLGLFASASEDLVGLAAPRGSWAVMGLYAVTATAGLGSCVELRRACWTLFLLAVACMATAALLHGDMSWISRPDNVGRWLPTAGVAGAVFCGLLLRQQIRLMRSPIAWREVNIVGGFAAVLFGPIVQQHALVNMGGGLLLGLAAWAAYLCALPRGHLVQRRVRRKPLLAG